MNGRDNIENLMSEQTASARALLYVIRESIEDDPQTMLDMVEGSTDLMEAIDAAVARISQINGMYVAIKSETDRLKARAERLSSAEDRLRALLRQSLEVMGTRKVERPLATLSIRATPPRVIIEDEAAIGEDYLRYVQPVINKQAIATAIKAGIEVPGARLSEPGTTLAIA